MPYRPIVVPGGLFSLEPVQREGVLGPVEFFVPVAVSDLPCPSRLAVTPLGAVVVSGDVQVVGVVNGGLGRVLALPWLSSPARVEFPFLPWKGCDGSLDGGSVPPPGGWGGGEGVVTC